MSNALVQRALGSTPVITSAFGARKHPVSGQWQPLHSGNDYRLAANSPIYMPYNGKVIAVAKVGGYGLAIEVTPFEYPNRLTMFAHLNEAKVKVGDYVKQGAVIALSGGAKGHPNAGSSTGPHAHIADGMWPKGVIAKPYWNNPWPQKEFKWENPTGTMYWDSPANFEKDKAKYLGNDKPKYNIIQESGYELVLNRNVNVRTSPDASNNKNIVRTAAKGSRIPYAGYTKVNGFDWKVLPDGNFIANGPIGKNQEYAAIVKVNVPDKPKPPVNAIKDGDRVKLKASAPYQNTTSGKRVPGWATKDAYPVTKVDGNKVRVGGSINSWLNVSDVTKV